MYHNLWSKLTPSKRESEIVRWIEKFRSQFEDLMNESDDKIHHFNYVVDTYDYNCVDLYDNGRKFASFEIEYFDDPGELIAWISEGIRTHCYSYIEPKEIEAAAETLKFNRTIRELVDDIEPEEL